eukprot:2972605-Ditylum_brightwellii.AAC.1
MFFQGTTISLFFQEEDSNNNGNGIQEEENSAIHNRSNKKENKREGDIQHDDVEDISNSRYNTQHHYFHTLTDEKDNDDYCYKEQRQLDHDEYENFDDANGMHHHHHEYDSKTVICTTTATDDAF